MISRELEGQIRRLQRELRAKDQVIERLRSRILWLEQRLRKSGIELSDQGFANAWIIIHIKLVNLSQYKLLPD